MKIRDGFVSNSSSSSFIFLMLSDNKNDLTVKCDKYKDHFTLYDIYNYNEDGEMEFLNDNVDVNTFKAMIMNSKIQVKSIQELLDLYHARIKGYQTYIDKSKVEDWIYDGLFELNSNVAYIEDCINKGFKYFIEIGIGDNHGDFCSHPKYSAIDQRREKFNLNCPDLVIMTECCH